MTRCPRCCRSGWASRAARTTRSSATRSSRSSSTGRTPPACSRRWRPNLQAVFDTVRRALLGAGSAERRRLPGRVEHGDSGRPGAAPAAPGSHPRDDGSARMGAVRAAAARAGLPGALLRDADGAGVHARVPRRRTAAWSLDSSGTMFGDAELPGGADRPRSLLVVLVIPVQFALAMAMALVINARLVVRALALHLRLPLGISELAAGHHLGQHLHPAGVAQQRSSKASASSTGRSSRNTGDAVAADLLRRDRRGLAGDLDHHDHPRRRPAGHPARFLEAADVFGATTWQKVRRVILPMLRPSVQVALILRTILAFQVFATSSRWPDRARRCSPAEAYRWATDIDDAHVAAAYAGLILMLSLVSTVLFLVLLPTREEQQAMTARRTASASPTGAASGGRGAQRLSRAVGRRCTYLAAGAPGALGPGPDLPDHDHRLQPARERRSTTQGRDPDRRSAPRRSTSSSMPTGVLDALWRSVIVALITLDPLAADRRARPGTRWPASSSAGATPTVWRPRHPGLPDRDPRRSRWR